MMTLPLAVTLPRKRTPDKKFILNLNNYRNTYHQTLNSAKVLYKESIQSEITKFDLGRMTSPFLFHYKLYPKTKRLTDLGNVLSIVQKFTEDALVEAGIIEDDNYKIIGRVIHDFGEVDKFKPRVELRISEL